MKRWVLFCWIAIWGAALAQAQEVRSPFFKIYTKNEGLISNSIYDISQDSDGFIWLATNEGLCRYDGYQFKRFPLPNKNSASGTNISHDRYGRTWYMTFDGYLYYHQKGSNTLIALKQNPPIGFAEYGIVGNRLYVIQTQGIDCYDLFSLTLLNFFPMPSFEGFIHSTVINHEYCVWYKSHELLRMDSLGKQKRTQLDDPRFHNKGWLFELNQKIHFVARPSHSFLRLGEEQDTSVEFFLNQSYFVQNVVVIDDQPWICTPNGVLHWQGKAASSRLYYPSKNINCIFKDREDNYWMGTANEGLLLVPDLSVQFLSSSYEHSHTALLGDTLFLATKKNQLVRLQLDTWQEETLFKSNNFHDIYYLYLDKEKGSDFITFSSDHFYFYLNKKNIDVPDIAIKECQRLDHRYTAAAWSGGVGLWQHNMLDDRPSQWDSLYEKSSHTNEDGFRVLVGGVRGKSVAFDSHRQTVYFGSGKGLFKTTKQGVTELVYENKAIVCKKNIYHQNRLFTLLSNGDLLLLKLPQEEFKEIPIYNNGQKQPVQQIKLLDSILVVFTPQQLFFANLNETPLTFRKIHIGAQSSVEDVEYWRDQFLLVYPQGWLFLHVDSIQKREAPRLVVHSFKANNHRVPLSDFLLLDYYQNDIEIDYSILSFNTGGDYPVYYQLNNDDWKLLPPDSRTLRLAALSPDQYSISFRLGNEEKYPLLKLFFRIKPAFWQTNWFWGGVFVLFAVSVYSYYRRQTRLLKQKNQLAVEKMELERNLNQSILTSIRSQMNPHFFYNALNTIQAYIFMGDKKNASSYLTKFSKLTRWILEMSEREEILLTEEINALTLYLDLEKARLDDLLEYQIELSEEIAPDLIKIPTMIVQPYVENAIKHGLLHKKEGNKKLWIRFRRHAQFLQIEIEDNGIGRERSEEIQRQNIYRHQSFATKANLTRIEILNKDHKHIGLEYVDKKDENGVGIGTIVYINIPITKPITTDD